LGKLVVVMFRDALIVKVCGLEVPPPGVGLKTVTLADPADEIREEETAAVSRFALTKVVVRLSPSQRTTEVLMKLLPFTVSVKLASPALAELGLKLVVVGGGLLMFVGSLAVLLPVLPLGSPPPETLAWFVTLVGALGDTLTPRVMSG
jgi:hypothetical protein